MSFRERWLREKLKKKTHKGFRGYPVATIAHYGPNDQHATKVVVSIINMERTGIYEQMVLIHTTGNFASFFNSRARLEL